MSNDTVIQVDSVSKRYRLGVVGTGTLSHDLNRWWAQLRGKPDPYLKIGQNAKRRTQNAEIKAETGNNPQLSSVPQPTAYSLQPTAFPDDPDYTWALRDVSFEVKQGEVLGIIGRNGAGKSTLLKILSRVTAPTTGEIRVKGRIASLLEVGTGFHPELTGKENIFLNGAILGMTKAEVRSKLDEIVDFSGIEKYIDTPVKRYSSGMYVRLAFAVAAHLDPEILILDEVLAVGDIAFQRKCLGKMGEVARAGRTVLFVSHNLAAIRSLCTSSMLLCNGGVLMTGKTDGVVASYLQSGVPESTAEVTLPPGADDALGQGCRLSFLRQDGTPATLFRLHEPWRAQLTFKLRHEAEHVLAAIGILTAEGVPVVTYWTKPKSLQPGQYVVTYDGESCLAAGKYGITVGISSNDRTFYYAEMVATVDISEACIGEQPVRASKTGILCSTQRPLILPLPSC